MTGHPHPVCHSLSLERIQEPWRKTATLTCRCWWVIWNKGFWSLRHHLRRQMCTIIFLFIVFQGETHLTFYTRNTCFFLNHIMCCQHWSNVLHKHRSSWGCNVFISEVCVYVNFSTHVFSAVLPRIQVSCLLQVCGVQWDGSSLHHVSKQASPLL